MSAKLCAVVFTLGLFAVTQALPSNAKISIDTVLEDAKQEVEKIKTFIDSASSRIESGAAGVIKGAYAAFDKEAEKLLQHAGSAGPHVSECINKLKSTVDTNTDALAKDVVQCVTSEADSALNDVETLIGVVQSAEKDIGDARAALKACEKLSDLGKRAECVAKETVHVAEQAVSLSTKVTGAVADAIKIYKTFPTAVSTCEQKQLAVAAIDAAEELEQLAKCSL